MWDFPVQIVFVDMSQATFDICNIVFVLFRGAYCAASVARLTNILTTQMFDGTPEWITRSGDSLVRR
jgi:hypothetical protein